LAIVSIEYPWNFSNGGYDFYASIQEILEYDIGSWGGGIGLERSYGTVIKCAAVLYKV